MVDINSLNNAVVSYYNFDENSGTTASDSKSTNDGTINGASWTTGKIGSALSFDGVDWLVVSGFNNNIDFPEPASVVRLKLVNEASV